MRQFSGLVKLGTGYLQVLITAIALLTKPVTTSPDCSEINSFVNSNIPCMEIVPRLIISPLPKIAFTCALSVPPQFRVPNPTTPCGETTTPKNLLGLLNYLRQQRDNCMGLKPTIAWAICKLQVCIVAIWKVSNGMRSRQTGRVV